MAMMENSDAAKVEAKAAAQRRKIVALEISRKRAALRCVSGAASVQINLGDPMADPSALFYFAYGSNLSIQGMHLRAPNAKPFSALKMPGWRLVFRGVADIEPDETCDLWGGLWRITADCEQRLDVYEGVSSGAYYKDYFTIGYDEDGVRQSARVLVYRMTSNAAGYDWPVQNYLATIAAGYEDFKLPREALLKALIDNPKRTYSIGKYTPPP